MAGETTEQYRQEVAAIERLRAVYPKEPQRTLARRLISGNHFVGDESKVAATASCDGIRPFFSIYSVIRRYDKRIKAAIKAAYRNRATGIA